MVPNSGYTTKEHGGTQNEFGTAGEVYFMLLELIHALITHPWILMNQNPSPPKSGLMLEFGTVIYSREGKAYWLNSCNDRKLEHQQVPSWEGKLRPSSSRPIIGVGCNISISREKVNP